MGAQTQTQTTSIGPQSGQERQILELLQRLGIDTSGQLGDLSALARGDLSALGPTGADRELIDASIGATSDIAQRQLRRGSAIGQANLDSTLGARGIQGSSIEAVNRAILESQLQDELANTVDRSRAEGSAALMNLPFQRASVALNANQALLSRLSGALDPVLQTRLQERLAQTTTKTKTPTDWAGLAFGAGQSAAGLGFKPFGS